MSLNFLCTLKSRFPFANAVELYLFTNFCGNTLLLLILGTLILMKVKLLGFCFQFNQLSYLFAVAFESESIQKSPNFRFTDIYRDIFRMYRYIKYIKYIDLSVFLYRKKVPLRVISNRGQNNTRCCCFVVTFCSNLCIFLDYYYILTYFVLIFAVRHLDFIFIFHAPHAYSRAL